MIAGMNFATRALLAGGAGMAGVGATWRGMGAAGRTAITSAAVGAGVSGITGGDMYTGAAMGALGGLGARWGGAGMRAANRALGPRGAPVYNVGAAFWGGMSRRFMRDIRGPSMLANRGYSKIRSTLKGWGR